MKPGFYWIQIGEQVTVGKRYERGEWNMLGYEDGAGPEDVEGVVIQQIMPPNMASTPQKHA